MEVLVRDIPDEDVLMKKGEREGTEFEKGVVLTEQYMEQHINEIGDMIATFSAYPDILLDMITPSNSGFSLFFYQRILLRAIFRYKDIFVTATRAFSKSFIAILGLFLQCVLMPGTKRFICAPKKGQSAKIAEEKLLEIYSLFPLLKNEVVNGVDPDKPGVFGPDYVTLVFRNGSRFDVVGALGTTRGGRRHGGLIDEIIDHEEKQINEIVLPLLYVSRRLPDGTVNEKEPNQQVIAVTSAGEQTSFAYDRLIDTFENQIIDPSNAFTFGCDYRVPVLHGLLDGNFINKLKMSPSYSERAFAKEYGGLWTVGSTTGWFEIDKMEKRRKLKMFENRARSIPSANFFYLLSTDVGRFNDQTVVCVWRVNILGDGRHVASLVNLKVLGRTEQTKAFSKQAIDLKKIIASFNPREVVIDTNGLGVGLADEMIKPQTDEKGVEYPAYGFINDTHYKKVQPKNARQILWGLKANAELNSQMHGNAYSRIGSGSVRFLISEKKAKTNLLATKQGKKMKPKDRILALMPYEMTTELFKEMSNLRLKPSGNRNQIVLEKINSRYPKDKYSALTMGLWRIKEMEDEVLKKKSRRKQGARRLVFFTQGR
jgi:hypothetical protein